MPSAFTGTRLIWINHLLINRRGVKKDVCLRIHSEREKRKENQQRVRERREREREKERERS